MNSTDDQYKESINRTGNSVAKFATEVATTFGVLLVTAGLALWSSTSAVVESTPM